MLVNNLLLLNNLQIKRHRPNRISIYVFGFPVGERFIRKYCFNYKHQISIGVLLPEHEGYQGNGNNKQVEKIESSSTECARM